MSALSARIVAHPHSPPVGGPTHTHTYTYIHTPLHTPTHTHAQIIPDGATIRYVTARTPPYCSSRGSSSSEVRRTAPR